MTDSSHFSDPAVPISRRELIAGSVGLAAVLASDTLCAQADIPTSSRELWPWVRSQPVVDTQISYLDVATMGPTFRAALAAEYRAREALSLHAATIPRGNHWAQESTRLATLCGNFFGCDADEVFFTRGSGEALSLVANGLDLASGDEVITTTREHPAALAPWLALARRHGIVVKQIELPAPLTAPEQALGLFAGAVTDRTRVLAFSHVQYTDGAVLPIHDLVQFARQRGILTVVDGAQAAGMLELDLHEFGCDFYATSFHKWLCASQGTGMLFVRREVADRLWPVTPGGIDASPAVFTPTDAPGFADVPSALHKFGNNVPHMWPALRGVEAAFELHQQIGQPKLEARVRELAIYARLRLQKISQLEILTPARPGLWAGILTLRLRGRAASEIATTLANARIYVAPLRWPDSDAGAIRVSLHFTTAHDHVDKFAQAMEHVAA
jgi:selenocysteine lyase/cysteine desulfurase